ncbi:MAG: protein translocase subunit SecD, partial [Beijerinckiaceae bacterium]|nr:protein translocase subunit SecD [Beijerinckiaceae bacterium]
MQRFPRWKVISILAMSFLALLVIIPSFLSDSTRKSIDSVMPKWLPAKAIVLGLDLQGGAHMLLQVDSNDVTRKEALSLRDDVRRMLREEKVRLAGGIGATGKTVQVRIPDKANRDKALVRLRQMAQGSGVTAFGTAEPANFTIDEGDNGLLRMTMTDASINAKIRRAIGKTIEVLRKRVDAFGTTEPNIQRQGADRVLVQVPGLSDTARLKKLIGEPAVLEFRLVADPGANPNEVEQLSGYGPDGKTVTQTYSVEKQVMVEGKDLTDAQPGFDSRTNEPVVNFRFNIRGGKRFGEVTTVNVGKLFAIILDRKV